MAPPLHSVRSAVPLPHPRPESGSDLPVSLHETLKQLPPDLEVVIRPKGGTVNYTDTAGDLVEDHPKIINLDMFELVSDVYLPGNGQYGGTLAELLDEQIEPVRFVIDGLIPEGLTFLAGKPKLGKSWLALGMSLAICAGHPTLGAHTDPAEVLYVALEDGKRRLQDRVRILDGDQIEPEALSQFHYQTEWPPFDQGGLTRLEEWMTDHPDTRLVVVDTWGKIRGSTPGKDRYQEEYLQLGQLQTFATQHRIALLLIHHLRKQTADDWLEQLSGSQAVTGAADTLLGLFRERGKMDATLRVVSREIDEQDLALKFDNGRWENMGDAYHYRQSVERGEIVDMIKNLGGEARVSEIAEGVGKSTANVSKMLRAMLENAIVTSPRRGVYALYHTVDSVDSNTLESTQTTISTRGVRGEKRKDLPDPW